MVSKNLNYITTIFKFENVHLLNFLVGKILFIYINFKFSNIKKK